MPDTPFGRLTEALNKIRGPGAAGIVFEAVVKKEDLRALLKAVEGAHEALRLVYDSNGTHGMSGACAALARLRGLGVPG